MTATAPNEPALSDAAAAVTSAAAQVSGVRAISDGFVRAVTPAGDVAPVTGPAAEAGIDRGTAGAVAVSVSVVVDYPRGIPAVADAVRVAARAALHDIGLHADEVTVTVVDVFGPFDTVEPGRATISASGGATAGARDV